MKNRYYDTVTHNQATVKSETTIIDSDPRVASFFKSLPEGHRRMYDADGLPYTEPIPAPTQDALDEQEVAAKWGAYAKYCNSLTVTTASGNKFAASPGTLKSVAFKRDAITDTADILWVESWGIFTTSKVELQEVISEAEVLMQAKIVELFGA